MKTKTNDSDIERQIPQWGGHEKEKSGFIKLTGIHDQKVLVRKSAIQMISILRTEDKDHDSQPLTVLFIDGLEHPQAFYETPQEILEQL